MEESTLNVIGAGIAMFGATIGGGFGLCKVFSTWLEGIARNPSAEPKISKIGFIAFAGTELVLLLGFVATLIILNK
ncbi:MAG: ATP synthase F0 subunit C [Alphaproteobacteria bacterium]|nr:ATP synthase F0 subunit C [Alphaproteobacteria bacterium]